jgi:hypothetical protein
MKDPCVIFYGQILMIGVVGASVLAGPATLSVKIFPKHLIILTELPLYLGKNFISSSVNLSCRFMPYLRYTTHSIIINYYLRLAL